MERLPEEISRINISSDVGESSSSSSVSKKVRKRRSQRKSKAKQIPKTIEEIEDVRFAGTFVPVSSVSSGVCIKKRINTENKRINLHTTNGPIEYKTNDLVFANTSKNENQGANPTKTIIKNTFRNSEKPNLSSSPRKVSTATKECVPNINSNDAASPIQSPKPSTSSSTKKKFGRTPNKNDDDKKEKEIQKFANYYTKENVIMGLGNGTLLKGCLRINPKFYTDAYVGQVDKLMQDYYIGSIADRNRALEGDVVILKIKPEREWRDNQKKAEVVFIEDKIHSRTAIGFLSLGHKKIHGAYFQPRDKRIPSMKISEKNLPPNFLKEPESYKNTLFMARLTDWKTPNSAEGELIENVGQASDIKSETVAILLENNINIQPFSAEMAKYLPKNNTIAKKDLKNREDLRKECIFTIDPATAKDLDDAVSCKRLPNGNFEVGVHIADVTHYLHENTPLDDAVCEKATSIYLVEKVYHMLPVDLCMQCSLLPGRDTLTFSVIWELNNDAEIISTRYTRSIINSCTKLAYDHAQFVIENPDQEYDSNKFPFIHNGYSLRHVCRCISDMQSLALNLRRGRLENGALRLDQIKLGFNLDTSGNPISYFIQKNKEANRLIEEFMLLANISVAKKIYKHFPDFAFLRCHVEPNKRLLNDVKNSLEIIGIHINIDSSGELNSSLNKYKTDDYLGYTRFVALNHLLSKPMVRAEYFCTHQCNPCNFHHYALSIPIYTHFTSPIRRYSDIMVHRLLSASLEYTSEPSWSPDNVAKIASNCNKKKFSAKRAGELSSELYLAHFVDKNMPFVSDAVVVGVQEKCFDAITISTGTAVRIYANNFDKGVTYNISSYGSGEKKLWKMNVLFPSTSTLPPIAQVVEILQIVQVTLQRKEKSNKLEAFLIRPTNVKRPLL